MKKMDKCYVKIIEQKLKENRELIENEFILRPFEEVGFANTIEELNYLLQGGLQREDGIINVCSKEFYV